MFNVGRNRNNPIISADRSQPWRANAAFNCSPADGTNGQIHLVYRAESAPAYYKGNDNLSVSRIAHALSKDKNCTLIDDHALLIHPDQEWDQFGCEDPRVTKIGDKYYIFYTAISQYPFAAEGIRSAVAITKDFKTIEDKKLVTPFNSKAMALFPGKVDDKWTAILTADSDRPPAKMAIAQFDTLEQIWSQDYWDKWYSEIKSHRINLNRTGSDHTEVGAAPVKTDEGWLLIYSHIQNYFSDDKIFGIEAVLLDHKNPRKIIARTDFPFMVPEASYEIYGQINNIVFPSGAHLDNDDLTIFYGAADTSVCTATLSLSALIKNMRKGNSDYVERHPNNPIIKPVARNHWESSYVLNPTALDIGGTVNILYRAVGDENTSTIGLAYSKDGLNIDKRLNEPIYTPRADFEKKLNKPSGHSGCEDARAVIIDDRIYITYTGYNGVDPPGVAASSISLEDFKNQRWDKWKMPKLISPSGVDDKDSAIFPEKIDGKYMILHRIDNNVCADFLDELDFSKNKLIRCIQIFGPRPGMWDSNKVGINGPPIKTDKGWLLFYHGITRKHEYCMGAVLLDLHDPARVISRTAEPIMKPLKDWEREGWINNVIFSCGQIVRNGKVYIYYGGADSAVGVATISLDNLLSALEPRL